MPAVINIIRGRDFLQTTTEGEIDLQRSKELLVNIVEKTVSPPDFDILIDLRRSQWRLSVTDVFDLATEIDKHYDLYRDKIAILVLPGTDPDATELLQVFSSARGLHVREFTNYEDAVQWFFVPLGL